MEGFRAGSTRELTALLIAPDRGLAQQLARTLPQSRAFQILAEMKSYPPQQTLDMRLKQLNPDVVLLDLGSNLDVACELIRAIAGMRPPVHVVGLHGKNDSEVILRSLRLGASEFLHAPFEESVQREAAVRLWRLRQPAAASTTERGKVILFSSAKPGAGASTLATQTAFALRRLTGARVLLADFDLTGGTIGFYLKIDHPHSMLDVLEQSDRLNANVWNSLVVGCGGADILPAPAVSCSELDDPVRIHDVLGFARQSYDWVVVDLPAIFHRVSLLSLAECDRAFVVTTSELPSLHLARKAVSLLGQLGFGKDRFHLVVNRLNKRDGIGISDIEKIFNCELHAWFPNDYFSLHRVVALGQPLGTDCELGRSVEDLAARLSGVSSAPRRRADVMIGASPVLSET